MYVSYELIHACLHPPMLAYFHFKKLHPYNFPSGAGRALVSIGSALVRNVFCATVGKRVGCSFKYGGYGRVRVCKIRPVQDTAVWYRRKWSNKFVVLPLVVAQTQKTCLVNIILLVAEIIPDI